MKFTLNNPSQIRKRNKRAREDKQIWQNINNC